MPKSGRPEPGIETIGAVILAAGSGRRIGTPKLRLESAGRSYLEIILDRLGQAEIAPVACVVAPEQAEWAGHRLAEEGRFNDPRPAGATDLQHAEAASPLRDSRHDGAPERPFAAGRSLLVNSHPEMGMFSSVRLGVAALRDCQGLFIIPVDHPFVALPTYLQLKQAFQHNPDAVIKPAFHGQSGHPVVLPREALVLVLTAPADASLQQVMRQSGIRQVLVEIADEGVLWNINQKADIDR